MPHTASIPGTITLPSFDPGTTANFVVNVNSATQPQTTATGTISVEFNGDVATAPLSVQFTGRVIPTATVGALDPRLSVVLGEPTEIAGSTWQFPATLTVL